MEALVVTGSPDTFGERGQPSKSRSMLSRLVPARLNQVLRFGAAGLASTLFYFLIANAFLFGGLAPILASTSAYLLSLGVSYALQSRFTFGVRVDSTRQVVRFVVAAIVGLVVSAGAMFFVSETLRWPSYWGTAVVCILIPVANYFVFKSWVFSARSHGLLPLVSEDTRKPK